ncbi:MAG: hypothetical protein M3419_06650 [Actinomycetota bacterium]|nr:hypothetical protein [Actinomycetota bacterium]
MRASIGTADEATVRLVDSLVIFWVVFWLVVGSWTGFTIWQLSDVGDTVTNSGQALSSTGEALQALRELPIVGDEPGELGDEVVSTGGDIATRGQEVQGQLRQLSLTVGVSIALMPMAPVLGLYLPLRLARRRELGAVRGALSSNGLDPTLERYLAERAVDNLPYATVRHLSDDPWRDIAHGRGRALARAELVRMGLRPPTGS